MMAGIVTIGSFLRRPAMFGVLQGMVSFACLAGIREAGNLPSLELKAYDLFLRLRETGSAIEPEVVLLAVTEDDVQQLGRFRWPLPFDVYSLGELPAGNIQHDLLRDKIVSVGIAADRFKEHLITFHRHGIHGMPGSAIHVHATSQLLCAALDGDRPIRVLNYTCKYAWIIFWAASGGNPGPPSG